MRRLIGSSLVAATALVAILVSLNPPASAEIGVADPTQIPTPASPLAAPDADVKLNTQTTSMPAFISVGETVNLIVNKQIHNNGPQAPITVLITKTVTMPAACTINGLGPGGVHILVDAIAGVALSVNTPYQEIDTIRCTAAGLQSIQVQNCVDPEIGVTDPNTANNCDTDIVNFQVDDGDGINQATETACGSDPADPASTPERLNSADDDGETNIDDTLPGGALSSDCDGDGYTGTAEQHVFNLAMNRDQQTCGTTNWPPDISAVAFPLNSLNKVNLPDLQSFILPTRRLETSPGDTNFDVRWDLVPGATFPFVKHINLADLQSMTFVLPRFLGGATRAFNGPFCRDQMYNRLIADPEQPPLLNASCGPFYTQPVDLLATCLNAGSVSLEMSIASTGQLSIPGRTIKNLKDLSGYESKNVMDGPLGFNWDFNYNRRLMALPSGNIVRMDGSGRADLYLVQTNSTYLPQSGNFTTLVKNSSLMFTERFSDGTVIQYSALEGAFARMTSVTDPLGNAMTFTHDSVQRVTQVRDTLGRINNYVYNAQGRLSTVTDFTGRVLTYEYDAIGNLIRKISPAVTGTPNGNDFPSGKTTEYTYAGIEVGAGKPRLYHNLLTVKAPAEFAVSGPPVVQLQYGQTLATLEFDRVLTAIGGGTNASGVPAGGTTTYAYTIVNPNPPNLHLAIYSRTTVTDPNGNQSEYDINRLGNAIAVRRMTNRDIRATDPASYQALYQYDAQSRLIRRTLPDGNYTEFTYDSGNSNRLSQANVLTVESIPDADRGGDQAFIRATYTYEPIYNQVRTATDPRGNDPSYVPPNGGVQSAARYTSRRTFDYEEGCDYTAIGNKIGKTMAETQTMVTAAGMCLVALGDINGDALTNQVGGNTLKNNFAVVLLSDANHAPVEAESGGQCGADAMDNDGDTKVNDGCPVDGPPETGAQCDNATNDDGDGSVNDGCPPIQKVVELYTYNQFGQIVSMKDPEANVHTNEYYPENDPNGDGTIDCPTCNATTGGYLKQNNLDTASDAVRNSQTNPTPVTVRYRYLYDARGNLTRSVDPRGIATDYTVNQLDQVVQVTRVAAHNIFAPDPTEPLTPQDFAYLERYFYDANDRLVLHQVEQRGNSTGVDGNLPPGDLPSGITNPDPVGGSAYFDSVVEYNILDQMITRLYEVGLPSPDNPRTQYRYDRNGNLALSRSPTSNLAMGHPDRQLSNVVSYVYDERDLPFTTTRGGTTGQWQALAANDDIPGGGSIPNSAAISTFDHNYDVNGNLREFVDAADTNSVGGREPTTYIYDGFDRHQSTIDAAGGQSYYTVSAVGKPILAAHCGPIGGSTPTSNGAATFTLPLIPCTFSQPLLTEGGVKHDELGRAFETSAGLFLSTGVSVVRPFTPQDGPLGGLNDGTVVGRHEYDRSGRLTHTIEDDEDGAAPTFQTRSLYDGANRALSVFVPDLTQGSEEGYVYNDAGSVIQQTLTEQSSSGSPALTETFINRYVYDAMGRKVRSTNNVGETTSVAYDGSSYLVAWSDAKNPNLIADPLGQYPGMINQAGNTGGYKYDGLGRRTASVRDLRVGGTGAGAIDTGNPSNPDGMIVSDSEYDVNGRVKRGADDGSVGAGDNNTSVGVIETSTPLGNVSSYLYDDLNRVTRVTHDDGLFRSFVYDADDNVTQMTDENGSVHTYTYDGLNRRTQTSIAPAAGVIGTTLQTFQYDALGRLRVATDNNGAGADTTVTFAYDSLGQVLEETQQVGVAPANVISTRWSGDGNKLSLIYPGAFPGAKQVNYTYDAMDRMTQTQVQGEGTPAATFSYIGSRLLERTYQNGVRLTYRDPITGNDVGYDAARRVVLQQHLRPNNSMVAGFEYDYDRMGNRLAERRLHSNRQDTYTYDSTYRLNLFTRDAMIAPPGPPASTSNYTLDGPGNWDNQATDNNRNEYTVFQGNNRTYDNNGNLRTDGNTPGTLTYNYDAMNRLSRVDRNMPTQTITQSVYDALGRDLTRTVTNSAPFDDSITKAFNGGALIQENGNAGQRQYIGLWEWASGNEVCGCITEDATYSSGSESVFRVDPPAQPPVFPHEDAKGNTAALSDVTGNQVPERFTYTDYGVPRFEDQNSNPTGQQASQFTPFLFKGGYWQPENRLYKNCVAGAHYSCAYKPDEGRTLSPVSSIAIPDRTAPSAPAFSHGPSWHDQGLNSTASGTGTQFRITVCQPGTYTLDTCQGSDIQFSAYDKGCDVWTADVFLKIEVYDPGCDDRTISTRLDWADPGSIAIPDRTAPSTPAFAHGPDWHDQGLNAGDTHGGVQDPFKVFTLGVRSDLTLYNAMFTSPFRTDDLCDNCPYIPLFRLDGTPFRVTVSFLGSDGDGLPDSWEVSSFLDLNCNGCYLDDLQDKGTSSVFGIGAQLVWTPIFKFDHSPPQPEPPGPFFYGMSFQFPLDSPIGPVTFTFEETISATP